MLLGSLTHFGVPYPEYVKTFLGMFILFMGVMLILGFWTRFVAVALLVVLAVGGRSWPVTESLLSLQLQSLYGILFFYQLLAGGGAWAVKRGRAFKPISVLDSEQSILSQKSSSMKEDELVTLEEEEPKPSLFSEEKLIEEPVVVEPVVTEPEKYEIAQDNLFEETSADEYDETSDEEEKKD